jgi:hypothetical protein
MEVWISLDENHEIVDSLEYTANLEASVVMCLKMSLTKEFKMAIALLNNTSFMVHLFEHLVDV